MMTEALKKREALQNGGNLLFPVFLKQSLGDILLVGAGPVGLEKLQAILTNMPQAMLTIVAKDVLPEVIQFIKAFQNVRLIEKAYDHADLEGKKLVIAAVNNRVLSEDIYSECHRRGILVNVADTPDLCDFYLASVVKKGNLKIAISTNGKSPTAAKRIRELLEEALPVEIDELLESLHKIRSRLKGNFSEKVEIMNRITAELLKEPSEAREPIKPV